MLPWLPCWSSYGGGGGCDDNPIFVIIVAESSYCRSETSIIKQHQNTRLQSRARIFFKTVCLLKGTVAFILKTTCRRSAMDQSEEDLSSSQRKEDHPNQSINQSINQWFPYLLCNGPILNLC